MRFSVLFVGLAALVVNSHPVLAQSQSDSDQCKFIGEISKADQSLAACDRIINDAKVTGPARAVAFSNRCGWWWAKKDPDRALSDCSEAIKVDRTFAPAYMNRGNAYLSKGDSDHAFSDFNEAIRLDPKSAWAYSARGDLYQARGDLDHALADLNEAIRLDPNNAKAYFLRGRLSYMKGENTIALADFDKAIRLNPEDAASYFSRGVAYFLIGAHVADAEADFKKANQLDPQDAYIALWLDLAERRNEGPGHLADTSKQLDMTAWPGPIVRQFLGELTPAQALAAAADEDPKKRQAQTCEANFYSGEFALLKKNKPEAARLFKQASTDCPPGFVESTAAIAELILKR